VRGGTGGRHSGAEKTAPRTHNGKNEANPNLKLFTHQHLLHIALICLIEFESASLSRIWGRGHLLVVGDDVVGEEENNSTSTKIIYVCGRLMFDI
jgi:hypothetical protein